jgi:uncharacterized protein (TIGR03067 family)
MRAFALPIVGTTLVLTVQAAPAPLPKPDPSKVDLKKMQGTWNGVYCREHGAGVLDRFTDYRFVIAGSRLTVLRPGMKTGPQYTLTLNARRKPTTVDMKPLKGKYLPVVLGVYSLKGDTLTICYNEKGKRPMGLSPRRSDDSIAIFRRARR